MIKLNDQSTYLVLSSDPTASIETKNNKLVKNLHEKKWIDLDLLIMMVYLPRFTIFLCIVKVIL